MICLPCYFPSLIWLHPTINVSFQKMHSGERSNKCNQCHFSSPWKANLRTPFENTQWRKLEQMQSMWVCLNNKSQFESTFEEEKNGGKKSNKCKQCENASWHAYNLRVHLKTHNREKCINANNVILHYLIQVRWGGIKKRTVASGEKTNKCNECKYATYQTGNLMTHIKGTVGKS